jgi:hypothetical protein
MRRDYVVARQQRTMRYSSCGCSWLECLLSWITRKVEFGRRSHCGDFSDYVVSQGMDVEEIRHGTAIKRIGLGARRTEQPFVNEWYTPVNLAR